MARIRRVKRAMDLRLPSSTDRYLRAHLALPAKDGPRPAVIVIHELFGLNDDMRAIAARVASLGYVVLAPDLYSAQGGPRPLCIARTMRALSSGDGGQAVADLEAARRWLAAREDVIPDRVGVIGFCMGGGFALLFAARSPLSVAGVFYGAVPREPAALEGICPVVAGYGAEDRVFAEQPGRLEQAMESIGVRHDVKVYEGAGHSFMNRHGRFATALMSRGPMRVGYNAEAAEDSWRRVEAFFAEHLG